MMSLMDHPTVVIVSRVVVCVGLLACATPAAFAEDLRPLAGSESGWERGIPRDPSFFPLAVWLQSPRNAERYADAGINLYVGLWRGPTEEQLGMLKRAGMRVICHQNELGLGSPSGDIIVGWMHGDEPDNAQPKEGGGYGPPILPEVIEANYRKIRERDPSRPVLLNLGQGVAFDQYIGRGVRRNHPEDYPLYVRGADIVSFDIYPAVHDHPDVAGKLEFVPRGVERLIRWSEGKKIVWNCIECSRISNTKVKPTAEHVRSEVWMSLIQGSRGIIYFVHQFEPNFEEASLLNDPDLLAAVTKLNRQITELAPVLNSPTVNDAALLEADRADSPIRMMCKRHGDSLYLFLANMGPGRSAATVRVVDEKGAAGKAESIDTGESLSMVESKLAVDLPGYGVSLVRVRQR
jgi:hypothetical protein